MALIQSRFIRTIQNVYPAQRRAQLSGFWIYARLPYENYGYDTIDEIDEGIFTEIARFTINRIDPTTKKNVFPVWHLRQRDLGWQHYSDSWYKLYNPYNKPLIINPTLGLVPINLPELNIPPDTLVQLNSRIHFISLKKEIPDLIIPQGITISLPYEILNTKMATYLPYF